ncbi:DNA-binding protein [Lachnellula occidentalis]|uniref:DNA-binding protein n=1 Tax=Lachnellula occidentalis TaxID=215460 RepID=A0A8H8S6U2_9HELO|nr:DNA-binding protein [Lachnellula occidentalis]
MTRLPLITRLREALCVIAITQQHTTHKPWKTTIWHRSERLDSSSSSPKVEEEEEVVGLQAAAADRRTGSKSPVYSPLRNFTTSDFCPAEARQSILSQILEPEAADRLGRIRMVKESRAADVENRLITLARSGQLRAKVTEEQLKELLNAVAETKEEEKIVVSRRKAGWDDDDDDLFDL